MALLVTCKAKIDLSCEEGKTPLYVAAKNGRVKCVEALLKGGAKTNLTTKAVSDGDCSV